MSSVIKVTPNKDGRYIINLYSKDYDVTNIIGEDGKGSLEVYGETYEFEAFPSKSVMRRKSAMKTAAKAGSEGGGSDEA